MALVAMTACRNDGDGSTTADRVTGPASRTEDLVFLEANYAPANFSGDHTPGGVIAVRLANELSAPVTITAIEPIAEDGLAVTYLGYATCLRGCPYAASWGGLGQELAENTVDGKVPLKLDAKQLDLSLVFRVAVAEGKVDTLLSKCVLRIKGLRVRLAGRSGAVEVTGPDGKDIGGLQVGNPRPERAKDCKSVTEIDKEGASQS